MKIITCCLLTVLALSAAAQAPILRGPGTTNTPAAWTNVTRLAVSGATIASSNGKGTNTILYGAGGLLSLDVTNRILYDVTGEPTLRWSAMTLHGLLDISSLDWGNRVAQDFSGVGSLAWGARQLSDDATALALDWSNRRLHGNWSLTGDLTGSGGALTNLNASNLSTGTLAAGRFPALTGDVTTSAGSLATTIGANTVALTTDTTGNYAAGDAEAGAALTGDSATAFFSTGTLEETLLPTGINANKIADGSVSSAEFQTLDGGIDLSGAEVTGTLAAGRFPALTGDVTTSAGSLATTIAANSVALGTDTTGNYALGDAEGGGATILRSAAGSSTLSAAGEVAVNSTGKVLGIHNGTKEVAIALIEHREFSFDPKAVCDGAVDRLFLFKVGPWAPNGITITGWRVSFEADPTTEADLDLKRADAFIGVANSAVMDVLDTTAGASSEATAANINSGLVVANGKVIYLEFGTAYTETTHQIIFEIEYEIEED